MSGYWAFRREYTAGTAAAQFAILSRDALPINAGAWVVRPEHIPPEREAGGTWDAFFWVRDARALHAELRANGADIADPEETHPTFPPASRRADVLRLTTRRSMMGKASRLRMANLGGVPAVYSRRKAQYPLIVRRGPLDIATGKPRDIILCSFRPALGPGLGTWALAFGLAAWALRFDAVR